MVRKFTGSFIFSTHPGGGNGKNGWVKSSLFPFPQPGDRGLEIANIEDFLSCLLYSASDHSGDSEGEFSWLGPHQSLVLTN